MVIKHFDFWRSYCRGYRPCLLGVFDAFRFSLGACGCNGLPLFGLLPLCLFLDWGLGQGFTIRTRTQTWLWLDWVESGWLGQTESKIFTSFWKKMRPSMISHEGFVWEGGRVFPNHAYRIFPPCHLLPLILDASVLIPSFLLALTCLGFAWTVFFSFKIWKYLYLQLGWVP